ncbi:hypothetical protein [Rhodococcus sp. ARC_M6]|uniref:hypothetical protein n=1 Tax=Rhodococcus sp. ARC_M6 TaxID=2928852 RepID=UPI001FB3ED91|nr:hypothetical protein [Rhodococcus sp. ARC_M6]MCJ0907032.1 hypothetical protein [Rhodococcus sp. ARC_M6]
MHAGSICEIGVTVVRDGVVEFSVLRFVALSTAEVLSSFDYANVPTHGIAATDGVWNRRSQSEWPRWQLPSAT